jgi:enamine deaminase RidA (YjgF/YER057c/UK114 family)
MTGRINISSGAVWEDLVGYSRAVRLGPWIEVSGTVAVDQAGAVVALNDPYEQTRFILAKIQSALQQAGAAMQDVIRTRMYVTDIRVWESVGRAHAEVFGEIRPATTMVEVAALIRPDLLIEIEASAVIPT